MTGERQPWRRVVREPALILTWAVLAVMLIVGVVGLIVNRPAPGVDAPAAWTIAPCSTWADTAKPDLPPHTVDSECTYIDSHGDAQIDGVPTDTTTTR